MKENYRFLIFFISIGIFSGLMIFNFIFNMSHLPDALTCPEIKEILDNKSLMNTLNNATKKDLMTSMIWCLKH